MAYVANHGGQCCGARHLYRFSVNDNINPQRIAAELKNNVPSGRMTEVILNRTQCISYPSILKKLADLGFVLTDSWINNNHNSRLYRFSRCDKRRKLEPSGFRWTGQIISAGLHGDFGNDLFIHEQDDAPIIQEVVIQPEVPAQVPQPFAPPPPRPLPDVVISLYYNVFRTTGRGSAAWRSYQQARERAPSSIRTDRMDVYSDGAVHWVENVIQ
jgi:hypothetical protein